MRLVRDTEKPSVKVVIDDHEIMTIEKARLLERILETVTFKETNGSEPLLLDLDTFCLKSDLNQSPSIRMEDLCKFKKALTKKIRIESLLATKDQLKIYFGNCGFIAIIPIRRTT